MKKTLALILAVVMTLMAGPVEAFAEPAESFLCCIGSEDIKVLTGTDGLNSDCPYAFQSGSDVAYVSDSSLVEGNWYVEMIADDEYVLNLEEYDGGFIYLNDPAICEIDFSGDCTVSLPDEGPGPDAAITAKGDLFITGDESSDVLTVTGDGDGIAAGGHFTAEDTSIVIAVTGDGLTAGSLCDVKIIGSGLQICATSTDEEDPCGGAGIQAGNLLVLGSSSFVDVCSEGPAVSIAGTFLASDTNMRITSTGDDGLETLEGIILMASTVEINAKENCIECGGLETPTIILQESELDLESGSTGINAPDARLWIVGSALTIKGENTIDTGIIANTVVEADSNVSIDADTCAIKAEIIGLMEGSGLMIDSAGSGIDSSATMIFDSYLYLYSEGTGIKGEAAIFQDSLSVVSVSGTDLPIDISEEFVVTGESDVTLVTGGQASNIKPIVDTRTDLYVDYGDDRESAENDIDPDEAPADYYTSKYVRIHVPARDFIIDGETVSTFYMGEDDTYAYYDGEEVVYSSSLPSETPSWYVRKDPRSGKFSLVLNDYEGTELYDYWGFESNIMINNEDFDEIILCGDSTIEGSGEASMLYGIWIITGDEKVRITGDGSLSVDIENSDYACGIAAVCDIELCDSVRVTVNAVSDDYLAVGITPTGDLTVTDDAVLDVTAESGSSETGRAMGISVVGDFSISGDKATVHSKAAGGDNSTAIYVMNDLHTARGFMGFDARGRAISDIEGALDDNIMEITIRKAERKESDGGTTITIKNSEKASEEGEENPDTGAPVFCIPAIAVIAAVCVVGKRK